VAAGERHKSVIKLKTVANRSIGFQPVIGSLIYQTLSDLEIASFFIEIKQLVMTQYSKVARKLSSQQNYSPLLLYLI
jgi:hypothetical protein